MSAGGFYVIRFLPDVPLANRKHAATLGRFASRDDAEAARMRWPHPQDLQVLRRADTCNGDIL